MTFHGEEGYINLLRKILEEGVERDDRTGVGTLSLFGEQLRFNLDGQFPLLTTKKVFTKAIIHELLFFIKGSTDSKILEKENVNIWKWNTTREFLDDRNLTDYEEGDLGPMYGFNWRHFNAEYEGCDKDYTGAGLDQLQNVINEIKNNPDSRRLLITTFNPSVIEKSCLMPCHGISVQFYVNDGYLSCMMNQRSCDTMLGLPFNITSYAMLTYMIAYICDLKPKELIISTGDTHIYTNHMNQVKEQITRKPFIFPQLKIKRNILNIDDFKYEDFEIIEYKCHPGIKTQMAV